MPRSSLARSRGRASRGTTALRGQDPCYPAMLREIADPPLILYAVGRIELLQGPALAIVGQPQRHCHQGTATARDIARNLSQAGLTIVSGLALGIDAAATRAASPRALKHRRHRNRHRYRLSGPMPDSRACSFRRAWYFRIRARHRALEGKLPAPQPLIMRLRAGSSWWRPRRDSGSLITPRARSTRSRGVRGPGSIHSPLSKGSHWLIARVRPWWIRRRYTRALGMAPGTTPIRDEIPQAEADPVLAAMGFDPMSVMRSPRVRYRRRPMPRLACRGSRYAVACAHFRAAVSSRSNPAL
jgi:DNA processing protein